MVGGGRRALGEEPVCNDLVHRTVTTGTETVLLMRTPSTLNAILKSSLNSRFVSVR